MYVLSKSLTESCASSSVRVFGGTAIVTSCSDHCKYNVILVIGMNGSAGFENPLAGSKSTSISKNATCMLGASLSR